MKNTLHSKVSFRFDGEIKHFTDVENKLMVTRGLGGRDESENCD